MSEPPAAFPPPVAKTIQWLQQSFAWYYTHQPPALPDRFTRREFGFMLWPERPGPPPFFRHRAYGDKGRFHNYLGWKGPHSCYYSTAYYRRPGEMKMVDKQWLGAELIFDLDADHLDEAEAAKAAGQEMPIEEQLRLVKGQFKRLLDEFIFGDFGVDPNDVFLTFSGGRGYHAHVMDPKLMSLDNKGRREIVDYITGKVPTLKGTEDPDLSRFFSANVTMGLYGKPQKTLRLPSPDEPGWAGRLTRAVSSELEKHVFEADRDHATSWLSQFRGIGDKSAARFVDELTPSKIERLRAGVIDLGARRVYRNVCETVLARHSLPLAKGETDEPVTADVKRLIRLPGSLHGKSGLKVVTMTRDELDDFDPFQHAVAFGSDPVRITPRSDQSVNLGGEAVTVKGGEETEVPMAHAVWMCARQQGTLA